MGKVLVCWLWRWMGKGRVGREESGVGVGRSGVGGGLGGDLIVIGYGD